MPYYWKEKAHLLKDVYNSHLFKKYSSPFNTGGSLTILKALQLTQESINFSTLLQWLKNDIFKHT